MNMLVKVRNESNRWLKVVDTWLNLLKVVVEIANFKYRTIAELKHRTFPLQVAVVQMQT